MSSEVFRFMALRPPQRANHQEIEDQAVRVCHSSNEESSLVRELKAIREAKNTDAPLDTRKRMIRLAQSYANSQDFVTNLGNHAASLESSIQTPLSKLDRWVRSQRKPIVLDDLSQAIEDFFGGNAAKLIADSTTYAYQTDRRRIADSLIVASILCADNISRARPKLMRAMQLMGLIERVAANHEMLQAEGGVERMLRAPVLLPPEIFPLPPKQSNSKEDWLDSQKKKREIAKAKIQHKMNLAQRLENLENARAEVTRIFATDAIWAEQATSSTSDVQTEDNDLQNTTSVKTGTNQARIISTEITQRLRSELSQSHELVQATEREVITTDGTQVQKLLPFSPKAVKEFSASTVDILTQLGTANDEINVPEALDTIGTEITEIASKLYQAEPSDQIIKVGNTYLPIDPSALSFDRGPLEAEGDFPQMDRICFDLKIPGLCSITLPEIKEEAPELPTVPHSIGLVRNIGMADLMMVKQELKGYEAGEIAHIENVLQGEFKERTHRRTRTTEESFFQETERTEESERDLESTDRFELQQETQKVINEETSKEAGITVTAKYGTVAGSIEATASANYASDVSKEESKRIASNYAKEVTDRSVSRLQERALERRFRRTVEEIEEVNTHGIDNKEGTGHVVGIYRWVDKIYRAQVVNYGKRTMFEFIIPEPAAFFRYVESASPVEGITIQKPDPPGLCSVNSCTGASEFIPLSPQNINPNNYLFWVSKYKVANIEPPSPRYQIISKAYTSSDSSNESEDLRVVDKGEIDLPDGYAIVNARVTGDCVPKHYREDEQPPPSFGWNRVYFFVNGRRLIGTSRIGRREEQVDANKQRGKELIENLLYQASFTPLESTVSIAIVGVGVHKYAFNVVILCGRTKESFEEWQLATYNAIISAYNEQKAQYEEQLAAAEIQEGVAIRGRNPLRNREIERTELKKHAISILTGQHFDLFNAMRQAASPQGYPQFGFEEVHAEGQYIQFFEQAFEWENMTYLFYPYFWGRKEEWTVTSLLDDEDPLFAKFLRAGAARVQIPVRLGYQDVLEFFFSSGGCIWNGGEPPTVEDELYVSIVNEIKEEQHATATRGIGVLSVTNDSPIIVGIGTEFSEDDVDREIIILGEKYRIADFEPETRIILTEKYRGSTQERVRYALGIKFVGEPWEIKIPTSLVFLQTSSELYKTDWA